MSNIIMALICILAGTAFLINVTKLRQHTKNVLKKGVEAYGEIKSIRTEQRGTSFVKFPVVEYEANGVKKFITDFWVSQNKSIYEGQPVVVIYDPQNESEYLIKEKIDSKEYMNIEGGMGGTAGIVSMVIAYAAAVAEIIFFFIG